MKSLNLVGKKFGKLKVLRQTTSSREGRSRWTCLCDCGTITTKLGKHLTRKANPVKSCGCLKKKKGKEHKDWKGYKDISGDWWSSRVMRSHKSRKNLPINITMKYAWNIFTKQNKKCYFTGLDLQIGKGCNASIDRIDNTKGYIKGNIRWVHKDINFMRRTYTDEYFINMCRKVVQNSSK